MPNLQDGQAHAYATSSASGDSTATFEREAVFDQEERRLGPDLYLCKNPRCGQMSRYRRCEECRT